MSGSQKSNGPYGGVYEGVVVDVNPPAGIPSTSVRVRIIGIHDDDVNVEDLPWATVVGPLGNCHGVVGIPSPLQPVWISFRRGFLEFPVVIGGIFTGLDHTSETKEEDIAGDHRTTVRGTRIQLSTAEQTMTSQKTEMVTGKSTSVVDESIQRVTGQLTRDIGSETLTVGSGRVTTVGATDQLDVLGDSTTTILGNAECTVGQDYSLEVMGQLIQRAYNVGGIPIVGDAIITEAVNGVMKMIAKTVLNIEGGSLTLDPVGLQTELKSLVRLVVQATANVVISGGIVQLGSASAFMPVALLGHVHVSPFMGLLTGPAIGPPGIGLSKNTLG